MTSILPTSPPRAHRAKLIYSYFDEREATRQGASEKRPPPQTGGRGDQPQAVGPTPAAEPPVMSEEPEEAEAVAADSPARPRPPRRRRRRGRSSSSSDSEASAGSE